MCFCPKHRLEAITVLRKKKTKDTADMPKKRNESNVAIRLALCPASLCTLEGTFPDIRKAWDEGYYLKGLGGLGGPECHRGEEHSRAPHAYPGRSTVKWHPSSSRTMTATRLCIMEAVRSQAEH